MENFNFYHFHFIKEITKANYIQLVLNPNMFREFYSSFHYLCLNYYYYYYFKLYYYFD